MKNSNPGLPVGVLLNWQPLESSLLLSAAWDFPAGTRPFVWIPPLQVLQSHCPQCRQKKLTMHCSETRCSFPPECQRLAVA